MQTAVISTPGARPTRRTSSRRRGGIASITFGKPRIKRKQLPDFTRSLATLLDAGLPVVRALRTLERQARDLLQKRLVSSLADQLEGGSTLSDAMRQYPGTFDRLFVNMIRAGEASGALDTVLNQLAEYLEKSATLKAKVKAALTYPLAVLAIACLITSGLMIFIVPRFAAMFKEMLGNESLPAITNWVVAISQFMLHHAVLAIAGVVALVIAYKLVRRTAAGGFILDYLALHTPPFNDLFLKLQSARFCSTLSTLIRSGVSVLQALQITRDTCGNLVVASAVQIVHDAVKEGEGIARPMDATQVFPVMVVSMVEVGEETGALPEMLSRIAKTYEERVDMAVDSLTALIEPLMIVILGGIVGTIVLAMFLPLIKMTSLMGGGM